MLQIIILNSDKSTCKWKKCEPSYFNLDFLKLKYLHLKELTFPQIWIF